MHCERRLSHSCRSARPARLALLLGAALAGLTGAACLADLPDNAVTLEQVVRGRVLVLHHNCAGCHNSLSAHSDVTRANPADARWLSGGDSAAFGVYTVYVANLTPDPQTGLGRFTARQVFNALRYGLDPEDTADVVITSTTPGQGNFPAEPHYLAPLMPWPAFRHMPDADLWDIAAYLQHGVKPVHTAVHDPKVPKDYWASYYGPSKIGPFPLPPFPAAGEEFTP
jgi:alcohol dehydrogenase (quinone), cytochrome c subunit